MNNETFFFFEKAPLALPLYEIFEQRLLSEIPNVNIRVQKTQISFSNKYHFAFVSLMRVRKTKELPEVYIVVTFGLGYEKQSPRIDVATEPYPNRWTHHVLISKPEEIDGELMSWIKEASDFSLGKH